MQSQDKEQNKELIRTFIEVFNKHDVAALLSKYYSTNYVEHDPDVPQGSEGFKKYIEKFFNAFPDAHATIEHILAEDDKVMVILSITATHAAALKCIPASGKTVTIKSAELFRIENGQIVEHWDVIDNLRMMMAIDAVSIKQRMD